jgi:uncharacterized membrane protein (UPF0127 family)
MRLAIACAVLYLLASCGPSVTTFSDINTQEVTLPGGQTIQVERMMSTADQLRGMMFRTSLAPDHGMLYVHRDPGLYSYWTYQYEIPLDMLWIDTSRQIVEIVQNVPPCKMQASQCPRYGGTKVARYHLELAGGMAAKYGLKVGQRLDF